MVALAGGEGEGGVIECGVMMWMAISYKEEGGGQSLSCMAVVCLSIYPRIPATSDGARRVFADQAGIACTEREAP